MSRPDKRLLKQLGVRSAPRQLQVLSFDAVDQQPVSLDVRLPIAVPWTPEGVVPVARGKRLLPDQPVEQGAKFGEVLPLPGEPLTAGGESDASTKKGEAPG